MHNWRRKFRNTVNVKKENDETRIKRTDSAITLQPKKNELK